MTTLPIGNSISRSPFRNGLLLTALVLAWFALSRDVRAVSPPPDGGYPNGNTAEGDNALNNLTTGFGNTANGDGALFSNTTGNFNTANGDEALASDTTGNDDTAVGFQALFNTTGNDNTANGFNALQSNTTGNNNTANGSQALQSNTTGDFNTATGFQALFSNTTGGLNTANGFQALNNNTTGGFNTANGVFALLNNTTGNFNTANGYDALASDTTGNDNTANGVFALVANTTGLDNTANGFSALNSNTTGNFNTATGLNSLLNNTIGSANTATGLAALAFNTTGANNTAEGVAALLHNTTGSGDIALGYLAGDNLTTGSNNIDIGNQGVAGEAAKIRIGTDGTQTATFIAGIRGVAVTGAAVVVNSSGQLGVAPSSARFKDAIKPMDKASEAILALKPVTFRYKHELDPEGIPQFGLVAEEVAKMNPDLVARDADGKVYTVRYEAVNAMLLNEFLKEHLKVEEQQATIGQLKQDFQSKLAEQQKQIKTLASGLEKISNQLEPNKPAPLMVAKNQ